MSPPPVDRPFVGRASELAAVGAHLDAAGRGEGRLVLVAGDAGIGKSRLLREALAGVDARRVLWGRCQETEGTPAHWPWRQALRRWVETATPARVAAALAATSGTLGRLVPELRAAAGSDAAPREPESARFRLFDDTLAFLRAAADELLVVVLEDLHWADSESLLLLRFVASEIHDTRLLIVGSYREVEMRQAAAVPRILGDLARVGHRIALAGLAPDAVAAYAAAASVQALAPAVGTAIHHLTGGNAFFMTEVVQLLVAEGRLADVEGGLEGGIALPDGVRDVIRRRVEPLPAATQAVLSAAAILGSYFDVALLAALREESAAATLDQLAPAVALGAVESVADTPGRYRFAHALLQDTMAGDLAPGVRLDLHRRAAAAFERVHAGALDPVLGEIAHHYLEAAPLGTLAPAIDYALRAGDHAYAALGYEEAAGHCERALQVSRTAATPPATRLRLLLALGRAQQAADDDGALATLTEAAELARALSDAGSFATAVTLAGTAAERTGLPDATIIRLLEEGLVHVGPHDGPERVFLLAQLARSLYFVDRERRHAASAEALAVARRLGDPTALRIALQARRFALWEPGTVQERRALGEEARSMAEHADLPLGLAEEYSWQIVDAFELGDMPTVEEGLRTYRQHVERFRLPRMRWHVAMVEAGMAQLAGRLADAERLAHHAASLCAPTPHNNVAEFLGVQLFLIYAEQGRLAELEPLVTGAATTGVDLFAWRAARAHIHLALGRHDAARQELALLAARDFTDFPLHANVLATWAFLAEVIADLDEGPIARTLLPHVARYADLNVMLAVAAGCLGSTARFAGLLARTAGDLDAAVASFEHALESNQRLGAHVQLAHTRYDLAVALRRRGERDDAARASALLTAAATTAERLGLIALQRRIAADLAARPPDPAAATTASDRTALLQRTAPDLWILTSGAEQVHLKDTKGVVCLVRLLRHPGQEIHARELEGAEDLRAGDAGEMLDQSARDAYRARLRDLGGELAEAEAFNDLGRVARLQEEIDALTGELTRATGLGGRARRAGSDAERARINVTRAVRNVLRRVQGTCPVLGRHLEHCVRTGIFCVYEPDPDRPLTWTIAD